MVFSYILFCGLSVPTFVPFLYLVLNDLCEFYVTDKNLLSISIIFVKNCFSKIVLCFLTLYMMLFCYHFKIFFILSNISIYPLWFLPLYLRLEHLNKYLYTLSSHWFLLCKFTCRVFQFTELTELSFFIIYSRNGNIIK